MKFDDAGHIYERVETLFVSQEYKVFLLTGQVQGSSGRRAYVSARPFNTLDPAGLAAMTDAAKPWDPKSSRITISANQQSLQLSDECTGTTSSFPLSELDADVKARLRYAGESKTGYSDVWAKFAGPDSLSTGREIPVGKPLQLKKNGPFNL